MFDSLVIPSPRNEDSEESSTQKGLMPLSPPGHLEPDVDEFNRPVTPYIRQKMNGERRANGALNLNRLSPRHIEIVSLHLRGWSGKAIAVQMGITQSRVSLVLSDPLAQQIIAQNLESAKGEIQALIPIAVDVVRDKLKNGSATNQFHAIDKLQKLQDMTQSQRKQETAEDFVQALLSNQAFNVNVQVNTTVNTAPDEKPVNGEVIDESI